MQFLLIIAETLLGVPVCLINSGAILERYLRELLVRVNLEVKAANNTKLVLFNSFWEKTAKMAKK